MSEVILTRSSASESVFPLTVSQYHQMIDAGVITADDPVELLEGILVQKLPKKPPQSRLNRKLIRLFDKRLPAGWHFQSQEPITLVDGEPEPGGAVIRGSEDDYLDRHPGPKDVAMVIEIADATLRRDRGSKLRSYARAGIKPYWIINLVDSLVEVYTNPISAGEKSRYRSRVFYQKNENVPVAVVGRKPLGLFCLDEMMG